ncbi:hypothetical protein K1X76_11825 [bacterium]|nr:hypothetical protein [bacterium]
MDDIPQTKPLPLAWVNQQLPNNLGEALRVTDTNRSGTLDTQQEIEAAALQVFNLGAEENKSAFASLAQDYGFTLPSYFKEALCFFPQADINLTRQEIEKLKLDLETIALIEGDEYLLDTEYEKATALRFIQAAQYTIHDFDNNLHYTDIQLLRSGKMLTEDPQASFAIVHDSQNPHIVLEKYSPQNESEDECILKVPAQQFPHEVTVYSGYGLRYSNKVSITPADWERVLKFFTPNITSAAQEREAISHAVAEYEDIIGLSNDRGGSQGNFLDTREIENTLQTDCIDETNNTQQLLSLLSVNGYLNFYTASLGDSSLRNEHRIFAYHAAAVMTERATGTRWVVDSWVNKGGELPQILHESDWMLLCE